MKISFAIVGRALVVTLIVAITGSAARLDATAASLSTPPVVVVYPLVGTQGTPAVVGSSVSLVFSNLLAQKGDVTVKSAPADTPQTDFLPTARKLDADYYVTGFVSPIGTQIGVVVNLVSARNGVGVWRTSTTIAAPSDASDSAAQLHDAILQFGLQRVTAAERANTPQTSIPNNIPKDVPNAPPPAVSRSTASAPSSSSSGAAPAADPQRVAFATPLVRNRPGPVYVVLAFDGPTTDAVKAFAPHALVRNLQQDGMNGYVAPEAIQSVASDGFIACAQAGADGLISGVINTDLLDPETQFGFQANVQIKVYNCRSLTTAPRVIGRSTQNGDLQTTIEIAMNQIAKEVAGIHYAAR